MYAYAKNVGNKVEYYTYDKLEYVEEFENDYVAYHMADEERNGPYEKYM